MILANSSDEEKTILVYAVDSLVASDGGLACRQLVEEKEKVGSWINMSREEVTLAPKSNELVNFEINVPLNAGVGEHNGCIVVQEKKPKSSVNKNGINLTFRSSMRVALTVDGEFYRKLDIINFFIEKKEANKYWLKPKIKNFGNVSIDTAVHVNVYNMFGQLVATRGGDFPIMRGETSSFNFLLDEPFFWGGWHKAKLVVMYDEDPNSEIGINVSKKLSKLEKDSEWFFVTPAPLAIVLLILLMALFFSLIFIIFLFVWIIPQRNKWIQRSWLGYTVNENDNIKTLAKKFNVSWRLLAKVNHLSPPFILSKGDKIKVPPKDDKSVSASKKEKLNTKVQGVNDKKSKIVAKKEKKKEIAKEKVVKNNKVEVKKKDVEKNNKMDKEKPKVNNDSNKPIKETKEKEIKIIKEEKVKKEIKEVKKDTKKVDKIIDKNEALLKEKEKSLSDDNKGVKIDIKNNTVIKKEAKIIKIKTHENNKKDVKKKDLVDNEVKNNKKNKEDIDKEKTIYEKLLDKRKKL